MHLDLAGTCDRALKNLNLYKLYNVLFTIFKSYESGRCRLRVYVVSSSICVHILEHFDVVFELFFNVLLVEA